MVSPVSLATLRSARSAQQKGAPPVLTADRVRERMQQPTLVCPATPTRSASEGLTLARLARAATAMSGPRCALTRHPATITLATPTSPVQPVATPLVALRLITGAKSAEMGNSAAKELRTAARPKRERGSWKRKA